LCLSCYGTTARVFIFRAFGTSEPGRKRVPKLEPRPWYRPTGPRLKLRCPRGTKCGLRRPVAFGRMMLILKYFLFVGAVLTAGLIALNAYLVPPGSTPRPSGIYSGSSASLPTAAPKAEPANTEPAVEASPPPPQAAAPARRSNRSARTHRRSQ
jgi:hypothetical protein